MSGTFCTKIVFPLNISASNIQGEKGVLAIFGGEEVLGLCRQQLSVFRLSEPIFTVQEENFKRNHKQSLGSKRWVFDTGVPGENLFQNY